MILFFLILWQKQLFGAFLILVIIALHEDACREEAQVLKVQQWLQHRMGPEETYGRLWEDLPVYMWLPLC